MQVHLSITAFLLATSVSLIGCDNSLTDPDRLNKFNSPHLLDGWFIYGVREVEPLTMWETQYRAVDSLVPDNGDLSRVSWFVADSIQMSDSGRMAAGLWLRPHTITFSSRFVESPSVACHESAHEIMQTANHNHSIFDRCMDAGALTVYHLR